MVPLFNSRFLRLAILAIALLETTTSVSAFVLGANRSAAHFYNSPRLYKRADSSTRGWKIQDEYSGETFFDGFTFYDSADPNHGMINYVNKEKAFSDKLAFFADDGTPGIRAEQWAQKNVGDYRDSVRIESKAVYNGGLFLIDLKEMPWGCGVWPAFWTLGVGAQWPTYGEIDIIEGIHAQTRSRSVVHTLSNCAVDTTAGLYTGHLNGGDKCLGGNGCMFESPHAGSYGEPFNAAGGGVFAMLWDDNGIAFWDWPRKAIPADIAAGSPDVSKWGLPVGLVSANKCDPWENFKNQQLIFTINLCGEWARDTYSSTPGCPGTCAERIANPANLVHTTFAINYIKVFEQVAPDASSVPPAGPSQTITGTTSQIPSDLATSNLPSSTPPVQPASSGPVEQPTSSDPVVQPPISNDPAVEPTGTAPPVEPTTRPPATESTTTPPPSQLAPNVPVKTGYGQGLPLKACNRKKHSNSHHPHKTRD